MTGKARIYLTLAPPPSPVSPPPPPRSPTGRAAVGRRAAAVGGAVSSACVCRVHIAHSGRWRHIGMNGKLYFNSMDELTFLSFFALAVPGRWHGYKELANSALE